MRSGRRGWCCAAPAEADGISAWIPLLGRRRAGSTAGTPRPIAHQNAMSKAAPRDAAPTASRLVSCRVRIAASTAAPKEPPTSCAIRVVPLASATSSCGTPAKAPAITAMVAAPRPAPRTRRDPASSHWTEDAGRSTAVAGLAPRRGNAPSRVAPGSACAIGPMREGVRGLSGATEPPRRGHRRQPCP